MVFDILKKGMMIVLSFVLILSFSFANVKSHAEEIDPGINRLTGDNISPSFYEGGDSSAYTLSKVDSKANAYTGKKYTHNSRFDNLNIYNGVDISQFNTINSYSKAYKAGIDYAFVRMGMRYAGSGNLGLDSKYNSNMKGCIDAGIRVGVYVYSQAITEAEAREEANHILNNLGSYPINMPLVLDYEFLSESGPNTGRLFKANLSKAKMTSICMAFCETIEAAGYQPMVYANGSMLNNHMQPATIGAKYPIWLANYTTKTSYTGPYDFWQYSSTGSVSGISGNVDCNFWYSKNVNQYRNYLQIVKVPEQQYTGEEITPEITVMNYKGETLTLGTDYTVTFSDNVDVGTAKINVTGLGDYAKYSKVGVFKIKSPKFEYAKMVSKTVDSITIDWNDVEGAVKYNIYRSNARKGTYTLVGSSDAQVSEFTDTNLEDGTEYSYYIKYYNTNSNTISSSTVVARTSQKATKQAKLNKKYILRKTPAKSSAAVLTVAKNKYLTYYCKSINNAGNTWYYVSYKTDGKTYYGYIYNSAATLYQRAKTSKKSLKVMNSTSADATVVTTISAKDTKITIIGEDKDSTGNEYYKITVVISSKRYNGYVGKDEIYLY